MPFKSKAQQRYLESSSSPLSASQKKEWEGATNFKTLPAKAAGKVMAARKKKK
jgi:hypothetical protein